jgi:hypothetical protein
VLRNKVGSTGVQTTGEETGHDEVTECPKTHEFYDDYIEDNLNHEVD